MVFDCKRYKLSLPIVVGVDCLPLLDPTSFESYIF